MFSLIALLLQQETCRTQMKSQLRHVPCRQQSGYTREEMLDVRPQGTKTQSALQFMTRLSPPLAQATQRHRKDLPYADEQTPAPFPVLFAERLELE